MSSSQQVQKLHPEFIKPTTSIEKNILMSSRVLALERQQKIDVWVADDPTKYDTLIWSRGAWGNKQWAGKASINLSNHIFFTPMIYSPNKIFYEIFITDNLIEHYPAQTLFGAMELDYNEYIKSRTKYYINDYSLTFTTSSETIGGTTYNFAIPHITDNNIKTSNVKITVKGYVVEWHGQDWSTSYDFTNSDDLLKWSRGKWSDKVYSGGSMHLPGTYTNTTVKNGYLLATSSTGVFESDVLLTSTKNIERIKLITVDDLLGGSVTYEISADGGSNWQTITSFNEYVNIANIGKQLKIKITITQPAMVDSIYLETDEFSITSSISNTNTKIELGNDTEGWTTVDNDTTTSLSVETLKYKITNISEDSVLHLKSIRLEYE